MLILIWLITTKIVATATVVPPNQGRMASAYWWMGSTASAALAPTLRVATARRAPPIWAIRLTATPIPRPKACQENSFSDPLSPAKLPRSLKASGQWMASRTNGSARRTSQTGWVQTWSLESAFIPKTTMGTTSSDEMR